MDNRKEIVEKMINALTDRGGFDDWWQNIDEDIQDEIIDKLVDILPIQNVSGSSLVEQYKALTKEERQDLNTNYCDCCLDDEDKNGKCYCSPQYDI